MTLPDQKVEDLRSLPGFDDVPDSELVALAALVDRVHVLAGDLLTREGTPPGDCFLIVDGRAEITVHGEPVAVVGAGEFVGEMSLLGMKPRSATVRALTPMKVLLLRADQFARALSEPGLAQTMLRSLAERLRKMDEAERGATKQRFVPRPIADGWPSN